MWELLKTIRLRPCLCKVTQSPQLSMDRYSLQQKRLSQGMWRRHGWYQPGTSWRCPALRTSLLWRATAERLQV